VQLDEKGGIAVDGTGRSSVPGVWAVGDVTNRKPLTPVALAEAHVFVEACFGGSSAEPVDYAKVRITTMVLGAALGVCPKWVNQLERSRIDSSLEKWTHSFSEHVVWGEDRQT
jgi:Pyridine nucleotide-disulphide oxidoreductase